MAVVPKNSRAEWQKLNVVVSPAVAGASGPFRRPVLSEVPRNIVDCAWMVFRWVAFQGARFLGLGARGATAMAMAPVEQASSPSLETMAFLRVLGELE